MNSRCIYYVEGECEKQLINALKASPEMLIPGKVKVYNVKQDLILKVQNLHHVYNNNIAAVLPEQLNILIQSFSIFDISIKH